jgi:hypothetical protein
MHNTLLRKFNSGINWNAFAYGVYKVIATILTLVLYRSLTTNDFALWANLNSIIYLALLWLDFGFRKSIPRFAPEFARNKLSMARFVQSVISFQGIVLFVAFPLCMYSIEHLITPLLESHSLIKLFTIGSCIFITEGITSTLRLIYHAYFWNKQFNILAMVAKCIELSFNIFLLCTVQESAALLIGILVNTIISGVIINVVGIGMLKWLYADTSYNANKPVDYKATRMMFIKHSGLMWINNSLKSLSERNFLIPLLTHLLGPAQANIFKVANDGALLFHRTIIKTIGTADTALLSHLEAEPEKQKLIPFAFQKVTAKIAALCIPLFGVLILLYFFTDNLFADSFAFKAFFTLTACYVVEALLSTYERILEVKKRYWYLTCAYIPYIATIGLLFLGNKIPLIGLLTTIVVIQGVRLVSSLLMATFATRLYPLSFPYQYVKRTILYWLPFFILSLIGLYFGKDILAPYIRLLSMKQG